MSDDFINTLYKRIKEKTTKYDEEIHCKLILKIMLNSEKGRISSFCAETGISERRFSDWTKRYELFGECYAVGRMLAREAWEVEGYQIRERFTPPGVIDHFFEHWRMIGWTRFGVSKNARIKLDLDPNGSPAQHYSQLLKQAAEGDFTAAEIKQLMEAVNVGLNTHQVFELQKQIDELKSDLKTMNENSNVQNSFSNKGIAQKD